VLIWVFLRLVFKRLATINLILKEISEGEGDLTKRILVLHKDEIGEIGEYFNKTLEKIKNLVAVIKDRTTSLFGIGNDLEVNMSETASAIKEITTHIGDIREQVTNQSASVSETHATMEQVTISIDRLNTNVEVQTASVARSSSAIEEMLANIQSVTQTLIQNKENVSELINASEAGRTGLEGVSANIREIAKESEGLLGINSVMESIASQTNLLSMNAAIEAAHAGEAGKGFAVVANEIRKLAENSSKQSKIISDTLSKIKGSIDKISKSTETVLDKFMAIDNRVKTVSEQEEHIRNAMEEQGQGSQEILEAIGKLNELTGQVKNSSNQMLEGSKEVINESKNLELGSQKLSIGVNEMASGADHINEVVIRVKEASHINKEHIDALVAEVIKFKIE
jgi:methyl-accepting chemotaxis protein